MSFIPSRHRPVILAALAAASLALAVQVAAQDKPAEVPYPTGFRAWTHVKSAVIGPANPAFPHFGGMHSIYANAKALRGYLGAPFPDGSMLVFDVWTAKTDKDITEAGERRLIDVMVKDSRRFAATGGWGYGEFRGDSHTDRSVTQADAVKQCHACHSFKRDDGYVFTRKAFAAQFGR